jgi:hypothetical protein
MMHYDITVNDDCEIRLSGDQTSDEAQANQQTLTHGHHLPRDAYPSTRASQGGRPGAPGPLLLPSGLNAAIENWRKLQLGRPKLATAILELVAGGLAVTTAIHKGESDPTTQDAPTETPAKTETAT